MSEKNGLKHLLEQWQELPPLDPQLKHKVWTRIASEDSGSTFSLADWLTKFPILLSRPVPALFFIGACIASGLFLADLKVAKIKQAQTQVLAQNYIELIESRPISTEEIK